MCLSHHKRDGCVRTTQGVCVTVVDLLIRTPSDTDVFVVADM